MKTPGVTLLLFSIFLAACATYPQSLEDQATYHVKQAGAALSDGDNLAAAYQMEIALTRPTGGAKVRELFVSYPTAREIYQAYLYKLIAETNNAREAGAVLEKITVASSSRVFSDAEAGELLARLTGVVISGNTAGSIPFDLSDNLDLFPELRHPDNYRVIVDRSIKKLQSQSEDRPVAALMNYVKKVGKGSDEGRRVESLLPTMNIRREELNLVAELFPAFAAVRRDELTARVVLQVKNGDRLFADDLLDALRVKVRGVEWVTASAPKVTTLTIERVRQDERTSPERSQTITYAQHEVNFLSAALLMPRNASYLYEVVSGGAEIEYGYVVEARLGSEEIHDQVVRGKVGGEYRRCQNPRIQNVFGGVTSAGFVANDDMQRRCSGPSSASMEDLRRDVLSKIVDGVLEVPTIKAVHNAN